MNKPFPISLLRLHSLLGVVCDEKSYIFGFGFIAKILDLEIDDQTLYISRSQYANHINNYNRKQFQGMPMKVVEKESELIERILLGPIQNPSTSIANAQFHYLIPCIKCKGKGFIDWIEETMETKYSNEDANFACQNLLSTYKIFELHNEVTVFYRERNLVSEYMQDCKLCPECLGIGYGRDLIERYIPYPIVDNVQVMIQRDINERMALMSDISENKQ